jgi:hypothetical protein
MRILSLIIMCVCFRVGWADWTTDVWTPEDFTQALGGGPKTGTAVHSGRDAGLSLCGDREGNVYTSSGQKIDIITPNGIRHFLAGTGERGYRDGLAKTAKFDMGTGGYYGAYNIACDFNGNVYIGDTGNRRVRRLYKKDGVWTVESWGAPIAYSALAIAVNIKGEVIVATPYQFYRISSDGSTTTPLGDPGTIVPVGGLMMGASDTVGNTYFVFRTPDRVIRVKSDGSLDHLAGNGARECPNGIPPNVCFDTPTSIAAAPNGEAVYVCGGDHYCVVRIPTDGITYSSTLANNGHFYTFSTDPKNIGYSGTFNPAIGSTKPLTFCHLLGNDAEGNLYGFLYGWTGMTLTIEGSGLLRTKLIRLRRTQN